MTVSLTINGISVLAEDGETVLDAANRNGIAIPSLCHHKDLAPVGSCRLCMVEVEGMRTEAAACALQAAPGMVVQTETARVAPGVVFGNLHFPGVENVNNLTIAALDPLAKIPEYKVCAVRVEKDAATV